MRVDVVGSIQDSCSHKSDPLTPLKDRWDWVSQRYSRNIITQCVPVSHTSFATYRMACLVSEKLIKLKRAPCCRHILLAIRERWKKRRPRVPQTGADGKRSVSCVHRWTTSKAFWKYLTSLLIRCYLQKS